MKVLNIVETAYRGTVEEQDDTILWLSHMLKKNGLDISILLRGNASNYLVRGQDASGLSFGDLEVHNPPRIDQDIEALMATGTPVYYVEEDATERGVGDGKLIDGAKPIARRQLPSLFEEFEQIWQW